MAWLLKLTAVPGSKVHQALDPLRFDDGSFQQSTYVTIRKSLEDAELGPDKYALIEFSRKRIEDWKRRMGETHPHARARLNRYLKYHKSNSHGQQRWGCIEDLFGGGATLNSHYALRAKHTGGTQNLNPYGAHL